MKPLLTSLQSEVTHQPDAKNTRKRLFGRSAESASLKEKSSSIKDSSSRHSKETSPATPGEGAPGEHADTTSPVRRRSKKRDSDERKASDRLSLFGNTLSGTLAKARKPVPRLSSYVSSRGILLKTDHSLPYLISSTEKADKHSDHEWSARATFARIRHGDRKPSANRPSTSDGIALRGESGIKDKTQDHVDDLVLEKVTPAANDNAKRDSAISEKRNSSIKEKEKRDSAVLRKRTSATSDTIARSPVLASQAAGGIALKPGKSILEQIGTPDHNGWLRKKSDRYNTWKLRYFVLKGSHLYCLKSNDKSVRNSSASLMEQRDRNGSDITGD